MADTGVKITILGSGTSTGVPVVGCSCAVCQSTEVRNKRSRCSALLSWGGYNVLIDTSPDLRRQSLDNNIHQVDAVLYTHGHADHVHGIDDLRVFNTKGSKAIPIYAHAAVIERLNRCFTYVFKWKNKGKNAGMNTGVDNGNPGFSPRLQPEVIDAPITLFGRKVEPIPLIHGESAVFGYRIGSLAYLTDCNHVPAESLEKLHNLDLLVIDALRFRAHPTHFTIDQAVAVGQRLQAKRIVLTHLTHDVDYVIHSAQLPENVEFAYDGMIITIADI